MGGIKVSVIVPIYQVEEWLDRCISSLVKQTLQEIEIILVNDASPDRSDLIMERYREAYPDKIKCIYLAENRNSGGARNAGVQQAIGEYLMFVDSDDYVDTAICEKLYTKAKETDSEVVCCNYQMTGIKNNVIDLFANQVMGILDDDKRKKIVSVFSVSPVAKIIQRKMWMENDILFPEHMKYEDLATMPLMWMYVRRAEKLSEPLYFYYRHEESTTLKVNNEEHYAIFQASLIIRERFLERGFGKAFPEEADALLIRGFMDEIKWCITRINKPDEEKLMQMRRKVLELIPDYTKNPYFYLRSEPAEIEAAEVFIQEPDRFITWCREEKWQKRKVHYDQYYGQKKKLLGDLLDELGRQGRSLAIWGAGLKGKDFLNSCDPQMKKISYVIDKKEENWGKRLETGHKVCSFDAIKNDIDTILVMNRVYFGGIAQQVREQRPEINLINVDAYILCNGEGGIERFLE